MHIVAMGIDGGWGLEEGLYEYNYTVDLQLVATWSLCWIPQRETRNEEFEDEDSSNTSST